MVSASELILVHHTLTYVLLGINIDSNHSAPKSNSKKRQKKKDTRNICLSSPEKCNGKTKIKNFIEKDRFIYFFFCLLIGSFLC